MMNEIYLNKDTNRRNYFVKCKTCGQYFPPSVFIVKINNVTCKSRSCKFCRKQKQMKAKVIND